MLIDDLDKLLLSIYFSAPGWKFVKDSWGRGKTERSVSKIPSNNEWNYNTHATEQWQQHEAARW